MAQRLLVLLILLFLLATNCYSEISVVGSASEGSSPSGTSLTFSHTVPTGTDKLIVVGFCENATYSAVSSSTWNSGSMTFSESFADYQATPTFFYLDDPATGTHDVVITFSFCTSGRGGALNLSGTKDGNYDVVEKDGTGTTSHSIDITTLVDGSILIDVGVSNFTSSGFSSAGAGQTLWFSENDGGGSAHSTYEIVGAAGTYTQTMTLTSGNNGAYMVLSFPPAATGGGPPTQPQSQFIFISMLNTLKSTD